MSKLSKALIAAAGNAGGAALYSEDVFSTYLYTGNGSTQTIENGIALGDTFVGTSTLFDGSSDYLSRSSDLTGNSDSGTFTLSFWLRPTSLAFDSYVYKSGTGFQFWVSARDNGGVDIIGYDSGGSKRLEIGIAAGTCSVNSWTHVLVSVDLSSTGSRYVYINDSAVTPSYFVYQSANIDFTNSAHGIGATSAGGSKYTGYLAHFYLDYTYRDLSVTANRRYFIDANGCATSESTQSALNPILYLPLTNSTTSNSGTGGNFTANGSPSIEDKGVGYEAGYGSGGLVWAKGRDTAYDHRLFDTNRGAGKMLSSNNAGAEQTLTEQLEAFNSDGFQVGNNLGINGSGYKYASWTFRKAEKFFDVVTYTGDGASSRYINHNLGANAGAIFIKRTDSASDWTVQHRYNNNYNLYLNSTSSQSDSGATNRFNDTEFTVIGSGLADSNKLTNISGATYVAYLFASDAGGFGDDGSENIIKCGSYVGNGVTGSDVTLGFEPQWIMIKEVDSASYNIDWWIWDNLRGFDVNGNGPYLRANGANAESTASGLALRPTATGFKLGNDVNTNASGVTYIYIAIRRPMKTPESGTEVFAVDKPANTARSTDIAFFEAPFAPDAAIDRFSINGSFGSRFSDRLRGAKYLFTNATVAEASNAYHDYNTYMEGFYTNLGSAQGGDDIAWMFKRATGFFDVVAWTGDGVNYTHAHNLGVVPELMILKTRGAAEDWWVYHKDIGADYRLSLQSSAAKVLNTVTWQNTAPTSAEYSFGNRTTGRTYISYLFATVAGVSKVGSYTGTGANQTIDCGFSAGARFVLIKRTDSTGAWFVFDSVRGIVTGNDPFLFLNSTDPEDNLDNIDPASSGFAVNSVGGNPVNISGGTYAFLAIA